MTITTYDVYSDRLGAFASSVSSVLGTKANHSLADENVIPFNRAERKAMELARHALRVNHPPVEHGNGVPSAGPVTSKDMAANKVAEAKDFQLHGKNAFSPLPTPTNS